MTSPRGNLCCRLAFLCVLSVLIAPAVSAQVVEEFDIAGPNAGPFWMSAGPDGATWFTMPGTQSIGRIQPDGTMKAFAAGGTPQFLTTASDGFLWFTYADSPHVGAIPPGGVVSSYTPRGAAISLRGITTEGGSVWVTTSDEKLMQFSLSQLILNETVPAEGGPPPSLGPITLSSDGVVWFGDQRTGAPRLGRLIRRAIFTSFLFVALPTDSVPYAMAAGDNGAVWFTDLRGRVGRVTREGAVTMVPLGTTSNPIGIARGADGAMWVTESAANRITRIDAATLAIMRIDIPTANSAPAGVALGPDSLIWFAERGANKIGRVGTPSEGADLLVTVSGPEFFDNSPSSAILPSTVTVRNIGTTPAAGVKVRIERGAGLYILEPADVCTTSEDQSFTSCDLDPIPAGSLVTIRGDVSFLGSTPDTFILSASAETSSPERNLGNNRGRLVTLLTACSSGRVGMCPLLQDLAIAICEGKSIRGPGPISSSVSPTASGLLRRGVSALAMTAGIDLDVFYGIRDQVFARTAAGRRYTELYYTHGPEIARILFFNQAERNQSLDTIRQWQEPLRALLLGEGSSVTITPALIASLQTLLGNVKRLGNADLRAVIEAEEGKLQLTSLSGRTMSEALARQTATEKTTVTLAAAASLHGVPPAFFHSDVRVFNPGSTAIDVTARYRCLGGSCNKAYTFALAPGEMKVFDEMVVRQFAMPESGGAIEFEGEVVVDSRLYTPDANGGTMGMYVPALTADNAYAESVLLSLAHSTEFRTNVGAYNPNDVGLDVHFTVYDRLGHELGSVTRFAAPHTPLQFNAFAEIHATGSYEGAYCVVRADGVHALFAFASVIDNRSQDLIFINGRNRKHGALGTSTLAAAASLHGVPPAFFHSDVTVFNPSPDLAAMVTARYRCFLGTCVSGSMDFELGPGQVRVFDDAVVSMFHAPESGGAIEFTGPVLVDSRLYTPARPAPSSGMHVPAAQDEEAYAESVLLSLSQSADLSRGFRTNAGAYNPNPVALDVTLTLFDPSGARLGEVTRRVPAFTSVQLNVFGAAGISADVANAYCVVRADGIHKLFAYAAVIDNRSQDQIYVRGKNRR